MMRRSCLRLFVQSLVAVTSLKTALTSADDRTAATCGASLNDQYYLTQKLDHFNSFDNRLWKQRVQISSEWYKPGGPVVVYVQAETEDATMEKKKTGLYQWMLWAQQLSALVVSAHHRYYQSSNITCEESRQNLEYLTSEQTLVDLANMVVHVQRLCKLPAATRWVAVGGSFGGTLAAWLRSRYPHLVHAAVASSAPLHFQLTLPEYEDAILEDFDQLEQGCKQRLMEAASDAVSMCRTQPHVVEDMFSLCRKTLSKKNNLEMFQYMMYYEAASLMQYHEKSEAMRLCRMMRQMSRPVTGFCHFLRDRMVPPELRNLMKCVPMSFEKRFRKNKMYLQEYLWFYEKCTQYGLFKTSKHFQVDLSYFLTICSQLFGNTTQEFISDNINQINTRNGGKDLLATRVIYVNGELDPWRPYAVVQPKSSKSQAIIIPGISHAMVMKPTLPSDPVQLTTARTQIFDLLRKYLDEDGQ